MSTAYVQAVAAIRALEAKLLNTQGLEQLSATAKFSDAVNEVKNRIYGVATDRMQQLPEALSIIDQEKEYLLAFVAKLVFNPQLAEMISWYSRLPGIKAVIKNSLSSHEQAPEKIKTWPEFIKRSWTMAQKEYERSADLKIVDLTVDACYLQELYTIVSEIHSPWLDQLCVFTIDFYNLKTWLRFKINNLVPKSAPVLFLSHGEIDRDLFFHSWDMPVDDFIQKLKYKPYAQELTAAWQQIKQHGDWLAMDVFFANYMIRSLQPAKLIYDGPEPVLAYLIVRLAELNNISIILSSKFYNLPKELITSRLSRSYV
jgi:vacuolar-type H+-ATPase subunit C/Vma6